MKIATAILIGITLMLAITACSSNAQQDSEREVVRGEQDAELEPAVITEPRSIDIFLMPDGFRNVARLCTDEGVGVYVTSRGGLRFSSDGNVSGNTTGGDLPSSITAVVDDPGCSSS